MVTVTDTGCGIPSPMLESLFQPSQSSRPGGLGVGLYQCKQMVEAHRGTIEIRSQQGEGTKVKIELPQAEGRSLKTEGRRLKAEGRRSESEIPNPSAFSLQPSLPGEPT